MKLPELLTENTNLHVSDYEKAKSELEEARRKDSYGKLSAKSFLKVALGKAGMTSMKELDEIENKLAERSFECEDVHRFVRTATMALQTDNYRTCPDASSRCVFTWGWRSAESQAAALGVSVMQLVALAVRRAVAMRPEAFGDLDDPDGLKNQRAEAEINFADAKQRLNESRDNLLAQVARMDQVCPRDPKPRLYDITEAFSGSVPV